MKHEKIHVACCICGGGPAGIMLGYLLARAGIKVAVLEKHKDFFRDFRGDTIHPSTIQLMYELDLLGAFLKVPHQEIDHLTAQFNGVDVLVADFKHLPVAKPILALMPQWDFLNFITAAAEKYSTFKLYRETIATQLVKDNNEVRGIMATTPDGELEITADLVIGADGRNSIIRKLAGLRVIETGVPIDVLWFRLARQKGDPGQTFGRFEKGRIMVLLDRDEYWQCALVIAKGDYDNIKAAGLDAFRTEIEQITPFLAHHTEVLKSWDDINLLSVAIDHLEKWYAPGLLCIGDAAHAMSPVGGVGINLAIQDAVATANILYRSLAAGKTITPAQLYAVQRRRQLPARLIQRVQVYVQNGMVKRRADIALSQRMPLALKILKRFRILSRVPARIVGMGVRPEHIRTPEVK